MSLALSALAPAAQAQTEKWPNKPVRMIVPLAPGGGTDIIARILKQPDVLAQLRTDSLEPVGSTPAEFARAITRDIATWKKVVKAGNIKVN